MPPWPQKRKIFFFTIMETVKDPPPPSCLAEKATIRAPAKTAGQSDGQLSDHYKQVNHTTWHLAPVRGKSQIHHLRWVDHSLAYSVATVSQCCISQHSGGGGGEWGREGYWREGYWREGEWERERERDREREREMYTSGRETETLRWAPSTVDP